MLEEPEPLHCLTAAVPRGSCCAWGCPSPTDRQTGLCFTGLWGRNSNSLCSPSQPHFWGQVVGLSVQAAPQNIADCGMDSPMWRWWQSRVWLPGLSRCSGSTGAAPWFCTEQLRTLFLMEQFPTNEILNLCAQIPFNIIRLFVQRADLMKHPISARAV